MCRIIIYGSFPPRKKLPQEFDNKLILYTVYNTSFIVELNCLALVILLNNFVKCVWSVELYKSSWNQGGSKVLDFHPSIQFEYHQNEKQINAKKILREKN